jgi:hypothetical protein
MAHSAAYTQLDGTFIWCGVAGCGQSQADDALADMDSGSMYFDLA